MEYKLKPLTTDEFDYETEVKDEVKKTKIKKKKKSTDDKEKPEKEKEEQPSPDETDRTLKLGKPKPSDDEPEADIKLRYKQKPKEDETAEEVVLKPFKKGKPESDDAEHTEQTIALKLKLQDDEQPVEEQGVKLKLKKKKPKPTEEAADEVTIQKQPEEQPESEDEADFHIRKPAKKPEGQEEFEAEAVFRAPKEEKDEAAADFTIKKKKQPTPVVEEHNDEYTIKKLKKRRPSQVNIPEYSDVEHVTFRPKSTRTKEDVEQEFNIKLDQYAEEEISMSGKVKLKKTKPKTYSEASDETSIKIIEDYEDNSGPIIEEILDDDSVGEDTMNDIDEPDLLDDEIEELPHHVEFKLKTRKPKAYIVEDLDEEYAVGYTHRKKQDGVSFGEDSFTLKTPSRKLPSSYLEGMQLLFIFLDFFFKIAWLHNLFPSTNRSIIVLDEG